ncbi:MAG: hypothetical protein ACR2GN_09155 [Bacteroidia bacterium]
MTTATKSGKTKPKSFPGEKQEIGIRNQELGKRKKGVSNFQLEIQLSFFAKLSPADLAELRR